LVVSSSWQARWSSAHGLRDIDLRLLTVNADRLDSRVWLLWGVCAMVPMLVSRHPLIVLEMLAIVLAVRLVWADRLVQGWGWIARVASAFVLVGVVFNALTVRSGNQVLFRIPEQLPLLGGAVTLNAVVYGFVSGVAVLVLVLTGTTVAAGISWSELVRSLPDRVAPLAVAGSVAWSFLPGASKAFIDIRESQASRGHQFRGVRDVPQLVVPLLEGGMERALTMAEALEARGFGAASVRPDGQRKRGWWSVAVIGGLVTGAYGLAMGRSVEATGGFVVAALGMLLLARSGTTVEARQRYRHTPFTRSDRVVVLSSLVAVAGFLWRQVQPGVVAAFNPYPNLSMPALDPGMVVLLACLLMPAVIAPVAGDMS
jgi:energy-coupling factor transport system permease protein